MSLLDTVTARFSAQAPAVDYWCLRTVDDHTEGLAVRQDVLQPVFTRRSTGAFVTVVDKGGAGYAATSDLTPAGLAAAAGTAREWAHRTANRGLYDSRSIPRPDWKGCYATPVSQPWDSISLKDRIDLLHAASRRLRIQERIVDWQASLTGRRTDTLLVNSTGADIRQRFEYVSPGLYAVANEGSETQRRSRGGVDGARQGGLEQLDALEFPDRAARVGEEALALLRAPDCPSGVMDIVLLPAQMVLQIHESIGHPLELDRILGDERNYAGTSFVTREMVGSYQYGSQLLNVTFDPSRPEQLASYGYDDAGTPAERTHIIERGILVRTLGSVCSQARSGTPGVANARACSWNRPPIDRMANLNLEPGNLGLDELVASVQRGVLMDTNRSWSIDDSRNKFQFGCEFAREIRDGELGPIVRNPNYRGISATFWRNLDGVGNADTLGVLGTANCGKGEPNQAIHVGHASPACLFRNVDVFGGA